MKKLSSGTVSGWLFVAWLCMLSGAWAQTPRAQHSADVDLNARLKETEANPRLLEAAHKAGAKVASFCANCHGDGGNSATPETPNLAGQNTSYLRSAGSPP